MYDGLKDSEVKAAGYVPYEDCIHSFGCKSSCNSMPIFCTPAHGKQMPMGTKVVPSERFQLISGSISRYPLF